MTMLSSALNRPWRTNNPAPDGYVPRKIYFGRGPSTGALQVATAELDGRAEPTLGAMRQLHADRKGKTAIPLVVAVSDRTHTWTLGPEVDKIIGPLQADQAGRILKSILGEPDAQSAYARAVALLRPSEANGIAGVNNSGLFATYFLKEVAPSRPDWSAATERALKLVRKTGSELIAALGFSSRREPDHSIVLSTTSGARRAVALLLTTSEQFETISTRFGSSPVAFGLRRAMEQEIPWLIVERGTQLRLYPGLDGVGVGQKGQMETFLELDLANLDPDYIALLDLVFSAGALSPNGTAHQLLEESSRFATALGTRLRSRIYDDVVPPLAEAVGEQLRRTGREMDASGLQLAYRLTLRILFRLLFQAYAEDRGLLPAGRNEWFDASSLQAIARRLLDDPPSTFSADGAQLWLDLAQVWNAIDQGNPVWQIPAYNGGLFSGDPGLSPEGALLGEIALPDSVMGPVLEHLLIDRDDDGTLGAVDFRSLSVREFGTIYEGLLESSLSVAETDLTTDSKDTWIPAKPGDPVRAPKGSIYFHSASGERKATGSYFTPKLIVDHLVERSVTPRLTRHLETVAELLTRGDQSAAEDLFFDFRVADLAMGSGHFLVAAVDKIEAFMRNFLTQHSLPAVDGELFRLAQVAKEALGGDEIGKQQVDAVSLLRRQVARRCIYGLDINPMAVELARLAIWIHTFVPGLPMSNLDHNLVCANSLTGVGTIDEALDALEPGRAPGVAGFFDSIITDSLADAKHYLVEMAHAEEANKKEVAQAAGLLAEARKASESTRVLFDAAVATRIGRLPVGSIVSLDGVAKLVEDPRVCEVGEQLQPAHMPYLFPEVFLRDNPGFDVLIGNPPWEKLHVEIHQWWGLHIPGLRSLPQAKRDAVLKKFRLERPDLEAEYQHDLAAVAELNKAVAAGPFPGIGKAHLDLYQAFAWRNWQLLREGGRFALVLPRGALSGSSLVEWRRQIIGNGQFSDVGFLTNTMKWVFEAVHPQYTVGLTVGQKQGDHSVSMSGPFYSAQEFMDGAGSTFTVSGSEFESWSAISAFPLVPTVDSYQLFRAMNRHPKFGDKRADFEFKPVQGDVNASTDRKYFDVDLSLSEGRIPVVKGASFNLWDPDFARPYAYADPAVLRAHLTKKLAKTVRHRKSAYYRMRFAPGDLPMDHPRIAFRDVARATDSRTMIACLLPAGTCAQHTAPLLVRREGDERAEAYLLGVLSSLPFDWVARRWTELHMTFEILATLPVPFYVAASPTSSRVVEVAGRLAAVDGRYREWADAVGVPVGSVTDPAEKDDLIAELDALVALLYGLDADQVEHVFATFQRGWDYHARLEAVLRHYHDWKGRS